MACHTGYQQVNGEWIYVTWNEGHGTQSYKLGADKATFTVIKKGEYAKDKSRVYHEATVIKDADPASFRLLSEPGYTRDRKHVFVMDHPIRGVDASTFVVLKAPFGRDAVRVYCGTVPIPMADRARFEPVRAEGGWGTSYSKPDFLFTYGDAFADLDISTENPVVTGSMWQWARDGRFYYYGPARVEGADYASFKILSPFQAMDAKRRYAFSFPESELPARRERRDAAGR